MRRRLVLAFGLAVLLVGLGRGDTDAQILAPYGAVACASSAFYDASTLGTTQVVAALSSAGVGNRIYVCGYTVNVGATATNVSLSYGTGTNCGTGTTALTPVWVLAANQFFVENDFGGPLTVPPGNALCVTTSAANPVKVLVRYLQSPST
jgi:hypothetical protein